MFQIQIIHSNAVFIVRGLWAIALYNLEIDWLTHYTE